MRQVQVLRGSFTLSAMQSKRSKEAISLYFTISPLGGAGREILRQQESTGQQGNQTPRALNTFLILGEGITF